VCYLNGYGPNWCPGSDLNKQKWTTKGISSGPTHRVHARPISSNRTGALVLHPQVVRCIRTDASGPTHRSTKFGSPIRRCGEACCPLMSSRVGLGPAWHRLNGRQLCWSKAGRAAWPFAAPPIRFAQRPGIGSLLHRPTHGEVTSIPALGPPHQHPMPSGLFKPVAAGQSSTSTMPSSNRSSPHNRKDHGQRNWIEGRAARAPTRPWSWRQTSREPWWWRPELVAATHPWTPRTSWTAWREQPCWRP
jgi:hypothetical protein